jgi:hypothetical protein
VAVTADHDQRSGNVGNVGQDGVGDVDVGCLDGYDLNLDVVAGRDASPSGRREFRPGQYRSFRSARSAGRLSSPWRIGEGNCGEMRIEGLGDRGGNVAGRIARGLVLQMDDYVLDHRNTPVRGREAVRESIVAVGALVGM